MQWNSYVITQSGNPEVEEYLVNLGIDENIILKSNWIPVSQDLVHVLLLISSWIQNSCGISWLNDRISTGMLVW
jgi:hypothetical protein